MFNLYIIHFEKPFHHAKHYIGMTENTLLERFKRHKSGSGAKITRAVVKAGIKLSFISRLGQFETARECKDFEIKIKQRHDAGKRFCPCCNKIGRG